MRSSGIAFSLAASLLLAATAVGGEIVFDYSLSLDDVRIDRFEAGSVLSFPDGVVCFEEGMPNLPGVSYCFVIPQGTTVTGAELEVLSETALDGRYDILPVRVTAISQAPGPFFYDETIYLGEEAFPSSQVISTCSGNRTGFRLGSVLFTPFRYSPLTGELSVITSARVTMRYEDDASVPLLRLTPAQVEGAMDVLQNIVRNPGDLPSFAPADDNPNTLWSTWVCISASTNQSTLMPLVNHRASHGMSAEFVSVEWITSNYTGYDTQEKIRNYLKDAFNNHGLQYALIVGDWGNTQRVSKLNVGGETLNETTDLYYSDLDGTWDADGDHQYGENTDGLDYYSDISVGRFSTNTISQIQSMVNRTVEYETVSPSGSWRTSALLAGAGLWPEYGYWGSFVCDSISKRIPGPWTEYKLYENSSGHPNNQITILNQGVSYAPMQGHGYSSGVYWYYSPTNMITNSNYTQLTNWGKFPVFHSIACLAGQLSVNGCIAERLMFCTTGGAIAVCFNSNNGIGTPPAMGPSEHLEVHFANQMFTYAVPRVGDMQAAAKDAFKAAGGMTYQNWVLQENNCLGDPATLFIIYQTGIEDGSSGPGAAPALGPAWPNPSHGSFSMTWSTPASSGFTAGLYDLSGRLVRSLDGTASAGSSGTLYFDGLDGAGAPLSPGCYFVRLDSESGSAVSRVVVLD